MATYFTFKSEGTVVIRVRVGRRIDGVVKELVNQKKMITNLYLPEENWNYYHSLEKDTAREAYLKKKTEFGKTIEKLKLIRKKIDSCGTDIDSVKIDDIINRVINAEVFEERERAEEEKEKKRLQKEEA